jgi:cytosine/adenosine deaminase-related metal-dependent hydrolase
MTNYESTLRSAAPAVDDVLSSRMAGIVVLTGGTLAELHPPRLGQADIVVKGEVIAQVGGTVPDSLPRVDVSGCIVMPAFVVAHTHLYMTLAAGMPPPPTAPRTLTDHLQWIWWALDKALDDELVQTSALMGAAAAAKAGAACLVDLHSSPRAIEGSLDLIEAALDEVGIRGVLAYETSDRDGRGRRDGGLRENRRFLEKVKAGTTRHRGIVGAHALMTLNDDSLDGIRELAERYDAGIHVHVAEDTADEVDAVRIRQTSLGARLERLGLARRGSVAAHGVHLPTGHVEALVQAGGFLATCARSNMQHGVGLCQAGGARVALGTDGFDNDLLAEARAYALRHTEAKDGLAREVGARIAAGQELAAMHFGERVPRKLQVGARADLVVLDHAGMTPTSASNLVDHVVRSWSAGCVRDTMVGGQFVVRERRLVNVDERALLERARVAAGRLWERMQGYT